MTREEIISRSFELFRVYGVKSVTLNDISGKLGVSKRTIYEHFKNKEEILLTGLRSVFDEIVEDTRVIMGTEKDPLEKLLLIYHDLMAQMMNYNSSYFFTINRFSHQTSREINAFKKDFLADWTKSLLTEASKADLLERQVDIELFTDIYFSNLDQRMPLITNEYPGISLQELFFHMVETPVNGISKKRYEIRNLV